MADRADRTDFAVTVAVVGLDTIPERAGRGCFVAVRRVEDAHPDHTWVREWAARACILVHQVAQRTDDNTRYADLDAASRDLLDDALRMADEVGGG